jgi:hypothetical protein
MFLRISFPDSLSRSSTAFWDITPVKSRSRKDKVFQRRLLKVKRPPNCSYCSAFGGVRFHEIVPKNVPATRRFGATRR